MENEITGFHAAQRFIEPQNHQRFVSTPDEEASCIVNDEHRKDAGSAESVVKAAEAAMNYKEEAE